MYVCCAPHPGGLIDVDTYRLHTCMAAHIDVHTCMTALGDKTKQMADVELGSYSPAKTLSVPQMFNG